MSCIEGGGWAWSQNRVVGGLGLMLSSVRILRATSYVRVLRDHTEYFCVLLYGTTPKIYVLWDHTHGDRGLPARRAGGKVVIYFIACVYGVCMSMCVWVVVCWSECICTIGFGAASLWVSARILR